MVETREYCEYGLCVLCGEANFSPRKIKVMWFCKNCIKERLEDARKIDNAFCNLEVESKKGNI